MMRKRRAYSMKFGLSKEEHEALHRLAKERGEPAAVLLREWIRKANAERIIHGKR